MAGDNPLACPSTDLAGYRDLPADDIVGDVEQAQGRPEIVAAESKIAAAPLRAERKLSRRPLGNRASICAASPIGAVVHICLPRHRATSRCGPTITRPRRASICIGGSDRRIVARRFLPRSLIQCERSRAGPRRSTCQPPSPTAGHQSADIVVADDEALDVDALDPSGLRRRAPRRTCRRALPL